MRLAAFGDSFTYGSDVRFHETWQEQLRELKPEFEVLNFGIGGYGLDQTYLAYRELGVPFKPHVVFIGFMTENIFRCVNVFRPFYHAAYGKLFSKPRFRVRDGALELLPNPLAQLADYHDLLENEQEVLARLGENDDYYQTKYHQGPFDFLPSVRLTKIVRYELRPIFHPELSIAVRGFYNPSSEAFRIVERLFDESYQLALRSGSLPIIVVYPVSVEVARYRKSGTRRYDPLLEVFKKKGYRYIDLLDASWPPEGTQSFKDCYTGRWGHYSGAGNQIVAQHVLKFLSDSRLTTLPEIDKAAKAERERVLREAEEDR